MVDFYLEVGVKCIECGKHSVFSRCDKGYEINGEVIFPIRMVCEECDWEEPDEEVIKRAIEADSTFSHIEINIKK